MPSISITVARLLGIVLCLRAAVTYGQYLTLYGNDDGAAVMAAYSGSAQWLVDQRDPRSHLHALDSLEHMLLADHHVTVAEIQYISTLPNLVSLTIGRAPECVHIDEGALTELKGNSTIVHIGLCKSRLRARDLHFLKSLRRLQHLTIELENMCNVRLGPQLGDDAGEILSEVSTLKDIVIRGDGAFSDEFIFHMCRLPQLEALRVSSRDFTDEALHALGVKRTLKELHIWSDHFSDEGVQSICQSAAIEVLDIHSPKLTGRSGYYAAKLPRLRVLSLPISNIDGRVLRLLSERTSLQVLDLPNVAISDKDLALFKGHPSLRQIVVNGKRLSRSSIAVLESITKLEMVDLGRSARGREVQRGISLAGERRNRCVHHSGARPEERTPARSGSRDGTESAKE